MASANEIPAGGEGKITVTVKAGARKRKIRQVVTVRTNDSEQPITKISVTANVLVDLDVIPNLIKFSEGQSTAQVILKNYLNVPVQLREITSTNKYAEVSVSSTTIPAQGDVILTARLLPDVPEGVLSGWVKIHSNLKTMPIVQIRLWGNVQK